ncbi:hypothetical protein GT648_09390 [[Clostridium] innocuum]|uniref:Uncharacterized protein n=1 Tax=Clostridium innocuum TaxID=1522 RepID=A0AB36B748_CLOIN|nr:hypothetical protein [[Clostridium] innocuum]MZH60265.1 hypothetical protein [[Clostridium] innocuum]MZH64614.1 hypothetical protein [[Clostridium] innocuum]MZH71381.1 hypothetical protein [[Clostridium] innocuum]MZH78473.1 hypothetical protein [[Clostridium] innocuum]
MIASFLSYFRVFAKGRLQLLLITTIVWKSPYVKFTCNRERAYYFLLMLYRFQ